MVRHLSTITDMPPEPQPAKQSHDAEKIVWCQIIFPNLRFEAYAVWFEEFELEALWKFSSINLTA